MADAFQVPTAGGIPPLPPGGSERGQHAPPPPAAQPFAPPPSANAGPAPTTGFTQADIDAAVAAALAGKAPAPAPAPAAPVALSPAAAISTPQELSTATDPVLTSMTALLTTSAVGLDLTRAIGNALTHGNAALIDKAYIAEKGGAQAAHLIAIAEGIVARVEAQATEGAAAVHSIAGGEQNWNTAAALFNATAPAHQKLVIKQLLDSGNRESINAAAQTVIDFATASGKLPQAPGLIQAGAAGGGAAQGLSKLDFQAELRKLNAQAPGFEQARADLFTRRSLGKQIGL